MFFKKYLKIKKYIFLLFFLYSNQILLSSELIQKGGQDIKYKSDLNLASNTQEKIESVTATGFGTTLEKASQNAATNALTQVVGSFIDAETIVKEQTNINNGIVKQTSIIREDIRDYSQGSIKYFEVLDIKENGSIFKVTARVDVKIEDFRAYIKKLASGSSSVSKELSTGLFTKAITNEENLKNKYNLLLKNIIDPIRKAEVYNIEIGDVKSLDDWQTDSNYCATRSNTKPCSKKGQFANHDKDRTFVIPFSISLKDDFRENMKNTLNVKTQSSLFFEIKYPLGYPSNFSGINPLFLIDSLTLSNLSISKFSFFSETGPNCCLPSEIFNFPSGIVSLILLYFNQGRHPSGSKKKFLSK